MSPSNCSFADLRARGFRLTPQRLAILQILEDSNQHLTPAQIYTRVAQLMPGITEPTVYRSLTFLADQGLALAAHIGSGQLVYERAHRDHHHLICRGCQTMLEIGHADLEPLYKQFERTTGFKIDHLHVTFFGLCPECRNTSREGI